MEKLKSLLQIGQKTTIALPSTTEVPHMMNKGEKRSRPLMTKNKNPDSTPQNTNIILGKI